MLQRAQHAAPLRNRATARRAQDAFQRAQSAAADAPRESNQGKARLDDLCTSPTACRVRKSKEPAGTPFGCAQDKPAGTPFVPQGEPALRNTGPCLTRWVELD